jgi:hypothetical protein
MSHANIGFLRRIVLELAQYRLILADAVVNEVMTLLSKIVQLNL